MILDAAQSVIFQKGLENTTMDEIAEKAELAKGTLYLYFKSKEIIQYEISKRGTLLLDQRIKKVIDTKKTGLENLVRIGWEFVKFSREEAEYFNLFLFFHNIDMNTLDIPSETIEDYFIYQSPFRTLLDVVESGIKDGSMRKDLPVNDTATALWSTLMGLLVVQENKKEIYDIFKVDRENILKTSFDIILNGIVNRPK